MVAGVIYDPIKGELFCAEKGAGAYLNDRRIRVTKTDKLEDALLGTGFTIGLTLIVRSWS